MKVNIRSDFIEVEGYVNAVERNSKPLHSRAGRFIERICKGAFKRALQRNDNVLLLLNHDRNKVLGSTAKGNVELEEDNIGLHIRAKIYDKDVIEDGRRGDLVGWSFGFTDEDVDRSGVEQGLPLRRVRDMNLKEVSLLNRTRNPAYEGTLVSVRAEDGEAVYNGEEFLDEIEVREERELVEEKETEVEETREEQEESPASVDYSKYENMIKEMKGEKE